MKKKEIKNKNKNIVAVIPFKKFVTEKDLLGAEFVVFEDGTIGDISKKDFHIKRVIKSLPAALRMYLLHILSQYKSIVIKIKGQQLTHLGQIQRLGFIKVKMAELIERTRGANTKELNSIIAQLLDLKRTMDEKISEITKKQLNIAAWSIRKGKIILEERERIQDILDTTFLELFKLYAVIYEKQKINKLAIDGLFKNSKLNLLNGLRTVKVNFREVPDDLSRIHDIIQMCERLTEINNVGEFLKRLFRVLEKFAPLVEAPIEIKFNNKKMYLKEGKIYGSL